jgi:tRNA (guanine-N7-)-methyltransferase
MARKKTEPLGKSRAVSPGSKVFLEVGEDLLRWGEVFPNEGPVEVEIGSGKGRYLLAAAAEHPDRCYLGIERRLAHINLCAERAAKRGLGNVRLIRADASRVVWGSVSPASVSAVHVYYPDPWWKARHKKRRIFTGEFVADVARVLVRGGELRVATDVEEYFTQIVGMIAGSGLFERGEAQQKAFGTPEEPLTSYQAKYVPLGRTIHGALFQRNGLPAPSTPDPRVRLRLLRKKKRALKETATPPHEG